MPVARQDVPAPAPQPKPGGLGERLVLGILHTLGRGLALVGVAIWNGLANALNRFEAWLIDSYEAAIDALTNKAEAVRSASTPREWVRALIDPLPLLAIPATIVGLTLAIGAWMGSVITSFYFFRTEQGFKREAQRDAQHLRLSPSDGRLAERRNATALGAIIEDLRDQGWSDDRITALIAAAGRWLTVGEIEDAYHRGNLSEPQAREQLRGLGITDEQVQTLFGNFERIPPATDLVRFVVREVYDPGLRSQQLEGIGQFPQFLADMRRQGFTDFDAASYWAAHWELPSTSQGYEMFHRLRPGAAASPFTRDDLEALLRRNDVLPAFIQQLIEVAYNPLTRVDVRRMFRDGVLDREQVRSAYLDLGYSPDNAELLATWVTKQRSGADRDLTKAEVVSAYKRRLIPRAAAEEALDELRYDDDDVALFLAQADYDLAQTRAGRRTTVIRQRYLTGLIDEATAINQLGDLQKPAEEIEELITLWREQREDRIERPTPAQLLGMYRDRVISGPDLDAELRLTGYDDRYVAWYHLQADADIAEAEARKSEGENRETLQRAPVPTRGDLANWLRRGIIAEDEFYGRLQAQGYQDADIRAYAAAVRLPVTLPFYGAPEGRVRTLEAKESFRRGLLTGAQLRLTLQGLGYPAELADAIADYEELRIGA